MPKPIELTESERNTLINGLQVAKDRFRENAQTLLGMGAEYGHLAAQFSLQEKDALALMAKLEGAETIQYVHLREG